MRDGPIQSKYLRETAIDAKRTRRRHPTAHPTMTPAAIASTSLAFTGAPALRMHPLGRTIQPIVLRTTKPTDMPSLEPFEALDMHSEDGGTSIEVMEARLASLTGPENKGKRSRLRNSIQRLATPSLTVPDDTLEPLEAMEERLTSLIGTENKGRRSRLRKSIERRRALSTGTVPSAVAASPFEAAIPLLPKNPSPELPPPKATRSPAPKPALTPAPPRYGTAKLAAAAPLGTPRQRKQGRGSPPRTRPPERGSAPNVAWRAVSMEELRAHPYFLALPEPHTVFPTCAADLRLYRQDSRQWWACHAGRVTTSACAPCLGLYEERAASLLGVPPSLRGRHKALDAHARLQEPPLSEYAALPSYSEDAGQRLEAARREGTHTVWQPHAAGDKAASHSLLAYCAPPAAARPPGGEREYRNVGQIRMTWGSVQEATSLLTALNRFVMQGATVEEAGLFAIEACEIEPEAETEAEIGSGSGTATRLPMGLPPIGASPDGLVRWPDGRVEPLEVKNHAPFASSRGRSSNNNSSNAAFEIRDPGPFGEVAVWHLPQLYLHMLCLGPSCRSCLFMSCSATRGANLFRVPRDDALMDAILHFVARFAREHGGAGAPPPPADFFWAEPEYQALLEALKAVSSSVERVEHIPNERIQRGGARGERLFFDGTTR
jgi:hypothetical protein